MGRPKKNFDNEEVSDTSDDFTDELISAINKDHGERIAYNLSTDSSPTHIKRWISTGSIQLDYAIANRRSGGVPEGRIIEIYGPPSIGKSHIGAQIAKSVQSMGGIAIYIDTENATSVENLQRLGIDVGKRFVFMEIKCIEVIFEKIEKIINLAREKAKDSPIVIIWDSIAASAAKAELEGEWDKDFIGIQARSLSRGFKKITDIIGNNNVLLVCLNQIRTKIGVLYGDPMVASGGNALPFYASVRVKLGAGSHVEDADKNPIGINVSATVVKNKTSSPFRKANFRIMFGKGIEEHEEMFDVLREFGPAEVNGKRISVEGTGAWKKFIVFDIANNKTLIEEAFHKSKFDVLLGKQEYKQYFDDLMDCALIKNLDEINSREEVNEDEVQ